MVPVVDVAEVAGRFGYLLHLAGVAVTPQAAGAFGSILTLARPQRTAELYWLARVTLVTDRAAFEAFDRVFHQVFGGILDAADIARNPHPPISSTRPADASPPPSRQRRGDACDGETPPGAPGSGISGASDDGAQEAVLAAASAEQRLSAKPFGTCTPEELERLRSMIGAFFASTHRCASAAAPGSIAAAAMPICGQRYAPRNEPAATQSIRSADGAGFDRGELC